MVVYYITLLLFRFPSAEPVFLAAGLRESLEDLLQPAFVRRGKDHDMLLASSRRALYMVSGTRIVLLEKFDSEAFDESLDGMFRVLM